MPLVDALPFAASGGDALFLVELGLVVLALAALARLASRVGLSPVPFYLIAGLAIGEGGVVDLEKSVEFIETAASVGVILLLLMLGLEYTADELRSGLRKGARAGMVDLVLNMTPGVVAGLLLGWGPVAALVLGGITYVSSSGIIAKLLSDMGRLGNRETPGILSVLVIEDLVMAAYLPLVAVLLVGDDLETGAGKLFLALGCAGAALVVALRFGQRLSAFLHHPSDEVLLLSVLGLVLLVAGAAEEIQVSAAVGAFLVGIALSGSVAERAGTLLAPLRDVFAAVFFIAFGLAIDPGDLPPALFVAGLLAIVGIATKVGTGWYAAARIGVGLRGRVRAGTALTPRGEFSILLASLAVTAGSAADLGPVAAAYVLITAIVGPVLTRFAEPLADILLRRREPAPVPP